jgi:hypothetical protein
MWKLDILVKHVNAYMYNYIYIYIYTCIHTYICIMKERTSFYLGFYQRELQKAGEGNKMLD